MFEGTGAGVKWGKRQLTFNEAANVATSFKTAIAGTYRVKLELEVNGSYTPDPGKARVVVKVDGNEMLDQEFAYYDEKDFTFETTQKWHRGRNTRDDHRAHAHRAGREERNHHRLVRQAT